MTKIGIAVAVGATLAVVLILKWIAPVILKGGRARPPTKQEFILDLAGLAQGLVVESPQLDALRSSPEFQLAWEKLTPAQREKVKREFSLLSLFAVVVACQEQHVPQELLNDIFRATYEGLRQRGVFRTTAEMTELERRFKARAEEYYTAINNQAGAGPGFHLGSAVTRNLDITQGDSALFLTLTTVIGGSFRKDVDVLGGYIDDYRISFTDSKRPN